MSDFKQVAQRKPVPGPNLGERASSQFWGYLVNLEKKREQAVVFFLLFLFRGLSVKEGGYRISAGHEKVEDNVLGVWFNRGRGYWYNVPDQSGNHLPESRMRTRQDHAADSCRS